MDEKWQVVTSGSLSTRTPLACVKSRRFASLHHRPQHQRQLRASRQCRCSKTSHFLQDLAKNCYSLLAPALFVPPELLQHVMSDHLKSSFAPFIISCHLPASEKRLFVPLKSLPDEANIVPSDKRSRPLQKLSDVRLSFGMQTLTRNK